MQLLKVRDFSEFFSDTFGFIKENAAHFFINFFTINSLFILGYGLYNYFVSKLATNVMTDFNPVYIVLFFFVFIILAIVYWTFTPIYMILYQQKGTQFNAGDILSFMSQNIGKILIFIFLSFIMGIVLLIPLSLVSVLLVITLVGILALPIVFAGFSLWFQLAFMEYINSDKSYLDAFGYGFTLFTKKFWATVGSNAILQMVIMVIYYLIAGSFGLFSAFSNIAVDPEASSAMIENFMASPVMIVLSVVLIVIMVVVNINAGIIYFSQKEFLEGIQAKSSIDDIGRNED